jgi:hypothetical protein
VQDDGARIVLYRRLGELAEAAEVDALAEDLRDRFGPAPAPVEALLEVSRVRIAARHAGVHRVTVRGGRAFLESDRGLVRGRGGSLPELHAGDGAGQLRELLRLLRGHATDDP